MQPSQQVREVSVAIPAALPDQPLRQVVLTVGQFSEQHPAFTPPALRNLIFKAQPRLSTKGEIPGNGLIECGAILRIGRKVLIDEGRFFQWIRKQNEAQR